MLIINNEWGIDHDSYNVTLRRKIVSKKGKSKGKERWIVEGYYQNMRSLVEGIIERQMLTAEWDSVIELTKHIDRIRDELVALQTCEPTISLGPIPHPYPQD